jgi:hypothetical protein
MKTRIFTPMLCLILLTIPMITTPSSEDPARAAPTKEDRIAARDAAARREREADDWIRENNLPNTSQTQQVFDLAKIQVDTILNNELPCTTLPNLGQKTSKPLERLFALYITTASLYAKPVVRYIVQQLTQDNSFYAGSMSYDFFTRLSRKFPIDHPIIKDDVYTYIRIQKNYATKSALLDCLASAYTTGPTSRERLCRYQSYVHTIRSSYPEQHAEITHTYTTEDIDIVTNAIDKAIEDAEHKKRRLAWMSAMLRLANNSTRVVDRQTGIGRFVPVFGAASTGASGDESAGAVDYDAAPAITDDSDDEVDGEGAEESKGGEE